MILSCAFSNICATVFHCFSSFFLYVTWSWVKLGSRHEMFHISRTPTSMWRGITWEWLDVIEWKQAAVRGSKRTKQNNRVCGVKDARSHVKYIMRLSCLESLRIQVNSMTGFPLSHSDSWQKFQRWRVNKMIIWHIRLWVFSRKWKQTLARAVADHCSFLYLSIKEIIKKVSFF